MRKTERENGKENKTEKLNVCSWKYLSLAFGESTAPYGRGWQNKFTYEEAARSCEGRTNHSTVI